MEFIIAGYGKFGQMAARRLAERFRDAKMILLDKDPEAFSGRCEPAATEVCDAAAYLVERRRLLRDSDSWIIPTVPFHLLARVALEALADLRLARLPGALAAALPNPYELDDSTMCCSYADFVCPDDCEEGPTCTVTGEQRKPLFLALEELAVPGGRVRILRSRQLCPGIGGYQARDFFRCIEEIEEGCAVIGTSCRCHAILTAVVRGNKIQDNASLKEEK
ncbi:MAG: hypothetical protein ACP5M0_10205 [Desulfomonilaceae bacterium]